MDNPFDDEYLEELKIALQTGGPAFASAKAQSILENDIPVNIAITGESGSGKSTFINAFRGVVDEDENAARVGCVETTREATPYIHPKIPSVKLWDLPGIGTTKFPAAEYLKKVELERFDFFIIISADRFRENDVKLAQEIKKMKKRFYFVRSKIDHNMHDEKRRLKSKFNKENTLAQIRGNCVKGLQELGVESPQVFLVSSCELQQYDFDLLTKTLMEQLPAHKRDALLMSLPIVNLGIIRKKKKYLQSNIKIAAFGSALGASAPIPGLSVAVDISMLLNCVKQYQVIFGLDDKSLQNLAIIADKPLGDLRAVMTSPLNTSKLNKELIIKILSFSVVDVALMAAEEGFRFIPVFGIAAAASLSFISTYKALTSFLNMVEEDAEKVSSMALGFNTAV